MKNTIVVDLQSGDCGKGKVCSYLMKEYSACAKFNGASNAGAKVVIEGKDYIFNNIPVSIIENRPSFIGSQCLINPDKILQEIDRFVQMGFEVNKYLKISPDCHVITQNHINRDVQNENSENRVGSTKQGVGPCAEDKYGRKGIRVETVKELERYLCDVSKEINNLIDSGQSVLFQGSQGLLLDIDHGLIYPHISTSNSVSGAACTSCGVGPTKITNVVGACKFVCTKVGTGPFPTEIQEQGVNDLLVNEGKEFGTVTGRRRKVGWLDLPALKYAIRINGVTELFFTKWDVVSKLKTMKICNGYWLDGQFLTDIPTKKGDYYKCRPNYVEVVPHLNDILDYIQEVTKIKIRYVSHGIERNNVWEF